VGPDSEAVRALAEPDPRPTAVVLSHAHIDHDGLLPHLRPDVPVYTHPDTVRLHRALEDAGATPPGTTAHLVALDEGTWLDVEDLQVRLHRVDHDIVGAVGIEVRTPDGALAYTGDLNLHRDEGRHTEAFMRAVAGVDLLVSETTMLSFDPLPAEPITETEVAARVATALRECPRLALLSAYERDIERADLLIRTAADVGRRLVWPGRHAAVLVSMGIEGVLTWDESRPQRIDQRRASELARARGAGTVSLAEVAADPAAHLVQVDAADMPSLLDLPLGPRDRTGDPSGDGSGCIWLHSQGEPLGPFMASWEPWLDWLAHLGITRVSAGSSGHAGPEALARVVREIAPGRVVALHGFRPEQLATADIGAVPVVLPEIGQVLTLP
jgi:ribonuclease J